MHAADAALFAATPLLPVPRFGELPALPAGRKRLLGAADGLYVEARSLAWDVCMPVAIGVTLPYGPLAARLRCTAGPVPRAMLRRFVQAAMASPDREIAAAVVIGPRGDFELVWPRVESASAGHVRYIDSDIDDERLVLDLHSHACAPAYFSAQDDASDGSRMGPYLAVVVGRCDRDDPEVATRLVMPPYLIPMTLPGQHELEVFG